MQQVQIGHRLIGEGLPVFVIAEIGVNHNGDLSIARSLIDIAVRAKSVREDGPKHVQPHNPRAPTGLSDRVASKLMP